jgi:hypothetical protein
METPLTVIAVLAGLALVVWAVGWTITRVLDLVLVRSLELAQVPDPSSPVNRPPAGSELDSIREFLEDQTAPTLPSAPYPVIDPTDWAVPEASRPKVTRVEPGEGLIPE